MTLLQSNARAEAMAGYREGVLDRPLYQKILDVALYPLRHKRKAALIGTAAAVLTAGFGADYLATSPRTIESYRAKWEKRAENIKGIAPWFNGNAPVDGQPTLQPYPTPTATATAVPTRTPEATVTPKPTEKPLGVQKYWESVLGAFGLPNVRVEGDFSDIDENNNRISDEAEYYGSEVYKRYEDLTSPPPTGLRVVIDRSNKSLGAEGVYIIFSNPPLSWPWGAQRYREGSGYTLRHFDDETDTRVGQNSVGHELKHWDIGEDFSTEDWFEEVLPTYYGNLSIFVKEGGNRENFKFVDWILKHAPGTDPQQYRPNKTYVKSRYDVSVHLPAHSLIGDLEQTYDFTPTKFDELDRRLQEKLAEGKILTRTDLRQIVEDIAGRRVETFDILQPWLDKYSVNIN